MVSVAEAAGEEVREDQEEDQVCLVWEILHKPLSQIALLLVIMFNVYLVHMLVLQLLLALTSTPTLGASRVVKLFVLQALLIPITSGNADIVLALSMT